MKELIRKLSILSLLALTTTSLFAASADLVVVAQADATVDRQAIQDAIDASDEGTTILLVGTFHLDGERILAHRSRLRLVGESVDDDGDGAFQEDWADGEDNDGDGLVDEDGWETVLVGVADPGGGPAIEQGGNALFNRGFVVEGAEVEDLEIRDLHFTRLQRAIELIPEWATPTGSCSDRSRTSGSARRVTIERNRFTSNLLGVTILGDVSHSEVRGNVFEHHETGAVAVEGDSVFCPLAGGGRVTLPLTTPRSNTIAENRSLDAPVFTAHTTHSVVEGNVFQATAISLFSFADRHARIRRNTTSGGFAGITIEGGHDVQVQGNLVQDASFLGIDLWGSAEMVRLVENRIEGSLFGIYLEPGASGFRMLENRFEGSGFADVLFEFGSHDNFLVNEDGPAITVADFGEDNRSEGDVIPLF